MQRAYLVEFFFLPKAALVSSVFLKVFFKKYSPCWGCFSLCWIDHKAISAVNTFEERTCKVDLEFTVLFNYLCC